jgi:CIC family chloride channel protein
MVAEMTGGYGLVVPAMLANVLAFLVQSRLTHDRLFPTLYRSQVETREDSPLHRGVFVRRAIEIVERGHIDSSEIRLPRLVNLLRYGEPIPVAEGEELLIALEVEPGSRLVGVSVMDSLGKIEGATAVAVLREEEMLVPRGPTTFASGDRVLIVATPEAGRQAQVLAADPIEAAGDTAR